MSNRPKPVELRVLEGNAGKRKLPTKEQRPNTKRCKPVAPANLPQEAHILWRELVKLLDDMGVLTNADRRALEMLCRAYADYLAAREDIEKWGRVWETVTREGSTKLQRNPAIAIANEAHAQVVRLLIEFGLTPAARAKVGKTPDKSDPLGDYLGRPRSS